MENKNCCGKENCIHRKGRCKKCGISEFQHKTDGYAHDHKFIVRPEDVDQLSDSQSPDHDMSVGEM